MPVGDVSVKAFEDTFYQLLVGVNVLIKKLVGFWSDKATAQFNETVR